VSIHTHNGRPHPLADVARGGYDYDDIHCSEQHEMLIFRVKASVSGLTVSPSCFHRPRIFTTAAGTIMSVLKRILKWNRNLQHFPRIHEIALRYFTDLFPSGPVPFLHPQHLEEALSLATSFNVTLVIFLSQFIQWIRSIVSRFRRDFFTAS
jgi:hypothetical protein